MCKCCLVSDDEDYSKYSQTIEISLHKNHKNEMTNDLWNLQFAIKVLWNSDMDFHFNSLYQSSTWRNQDRKKDVESTIDGESV